MMASHEELVEYAASPRTLVDHYLTGRRAPEGAPNPVTVRLHAGTVSRLSDLARYLGVPRGQLMREFLEGALAEALDQVERNTGKPVPTREGK